MFNKPRALDLFSGAGFIKIYTMKKNKTTEANRQFWSYIEQTSQRVAKWPGWMRGEGEVHTPPEPDKGSATREPPRKQRGRVRGKQ